MGLSQPFSKFNVNVSCLTPKVGEILFPSGVDEGGLGTGSIAERSSEEA